MNEAPVDDQKAPTSSYRRLLLWAGVLVCAAGLCLVYVRRERRHADQLGRENAELQASLSQTRSQVAALNTRLNALSGPASTPATPPAPKASLKSDRRHAATRAKSAENPRWKQVESQLADQQKQISAAQQDLAKTRDELDSRLSSTRDELNGTIARNHDELVALEKKGDREYYEFDLTKSKEFKHIGPVSLSLRKADTKRQFCDLRVLVDDVELTQKHVNLYEPVTLYPADYTQPLELVFNQIGGNRARGYVSAPKYKANELATGTAAPATPQASPAPSNTETNLEHRPGFEP
jgi:uncharacterized coiled-coil protein SlyX